MPAIGELFLCIVEREQYIFALAKKLRDMLAT